MTKKTEEIILTKDSSDNMVKKRAKQLGFQPHSFLRGWNTVKNSK